MGEPGHILSEIIAQKRRHVSARLGQASLDDLRPRARPTRISLASALEAPGARFIMEVKRSSPSQGTMDTKADPAALARAWHKPADAISVLLDEPFFGGSLADLETVRGAYDGPVLAKDFFVDPRQVPEARLHGADAILVMLSVLDDPMARQMMDEADRLGMDVLVEVHDPDELARAIALGARLIGINNRDLRTLEVDLAVTERLAPLVPRDRILVSESGIGSRADVDRLSPLVDAFLVGSSLMKSDRPALAARALAFGRVKICGLTREADAHFAFDQGASHLGMVFVPGSPRQVTAEQARPIARFALRQGIQGAGVFRDHPVAEIVRTAQDLALDIVQLHGMEDIVYIAALRGELPLETEIWVAHPVGETIAQRPTADRPLFDSLVDGRSGGTGLPFDWTLVADRADLDRAFVGGGLCPENIAAAAALGAYGLDVGSGVEAAPGRKDPDRLSCLFEALRPVSRGDR